MATETELRRIAQASHQLEAWLGANTGTNADWPIRLTTDETSADQLCALLNELKDALKPYRHELARHN